MYPVFGHKYPNLHTQPLKKSKVYHIYVYFHTSSPSWHLDFRYTCPLLVSLLADSCLQCPWLWQNGEFVESLCLAGPEPHGELANSPGRSCRAECERRRQIECQNECHVLKKCHRQWRVKYQCRMPEKTPSRLPVNCSRMPKKFEVECQNVWSKKSTSKTSQQMLRSRIKFQNVCLA